MKRTWAPDSGWTGDWPLPDVLGRRLSVSERGALVAMSCGGMGPQRLASALAMSDRIDDVAGAFGAHGREALRHLRCLGARVVVPSDDEYPALLREIDAPPPLLFVRGRSLDELSPCVAIVGARACTSGAKRFARKLGSAIAAAGFTVVSGLARGVDSAAHEGALETGRTIAVLGCGIDVCYPIENKELSGRIVSSGALVTEFPPGIGPRAWHFPARNRIIAGLAIALVVVEAGSGSGALITADFAMNANREVYACTVGPENPAGSGVREMLKDGAHLVVDADQAVVDLLALARSQGVEVVRGAALRASERNGAPSGDLGLVYAAITEDTPAEQIAASTGFPIAQVSVLLAELELDGVASCEDGRWRRS